jgi:transposase-like protein
LDKQQKFRSMVALDGAAVSDVALQYGAPRQSVYNWKADSNGTVKQG